jgi:hypothetical protein
MVLQAINLGILVFLFFIIGMIKPKWALFFMEKPTRWPIIAISTVFFMIVMTMYGEGIRQQKILEKHQKQTTATAAAATPVPTPESVPVPIPSETPKTAPKKK